MKKNILVIAPHPDDEVLGCGGMINKNTSLGNDVYILVVTRGSAKRYKEDKIVNVRKEALNAHEILGVKETIFFDFPAPDLDLVSKADIAGKINEVIRYKDINEIYLPHRGDIHHDHEVVFDAGLVAARPNQGSKVKRIFSYETLSETEWAAPFSSKVFIPNYFLNIENEITVKIKAMMCFKSQIKDFPNSRSARSIQALSEMRGCTVGFKAAEAFMIIRVIES